MKYVHAHITSHNMTRSDSSNGITASVVGSVIRGAYSGNKMECEAVNAASFSFDSLILTRLRESAGSNEIMT